MLTREIIDEFIRNSFFRPVTTRTEIKLLPRILQPGEGLIGLVEGSIKRLHSKEINRRGLIIATDNRILFFRKGIIGKMIVETIAPLPVLAVSVLTEENVLSSTIIIKRSQNVDAVINLCGNNEAKEFGRRVQAAIFH